MKPYKCPNGNAPADCRHVQQLIRNAISFFAASKEKEGCGGTESINAGNGACRPARSKKKSR